MRIHLYTLCWNEIDIIPFCIDYWKKLGIEKAVVYDNGSTDGSVEYLKTIPFVEVRTYETDGMSDSALRDMKNNMWKESIGNADWVIVCDMDEILFSDHLEEELQYMSDNGFTVLGNMWYYLCGEHKPEYEEGKLLHELIGRGCENHINTQFSDIGKLILFNPNEIEEIGYHIGAHGNEIKGNYKLYKSKRILTFHVEKGFGVEYKIERYKQMAERLCDENKRNGWSYHYTFSPEKIKQSYEESVKNSVDLMEVVKKANEAGINYDTPDNPAFDVGRAWSMIYKTLIDSRYVMDKAIERSGGYVTEQDVKAIAQFILNGVNCALQ